MDKPVEMAAARVEQAAPVAPLPKSPPVPAARPQFRRLWLVGTLLGLAALAAAGVWWFSSADGAINYTSAPVTRGDVTRVVTATGTVNPVLTIIVGSYVSGVIQEIHCDYNTKVTKGQVCAKIDPRPYQSIVDQNQANLAQAKAQLVKDRANFDYTQLNYDRNARLAQTNAISKDTLDLAKNALDQARAQVGVDEAAIQQRQAQLDAAQVNLGYTDIISPVDGTVVSRNVTVGQTVAASFQTPTLFLIATDLAKMQVDTNVSESDIGGIKEQNKAIFTVDAFPKRTFEGTVTQVRQSPQTVQNVVTYDVVVSVANPDLALKPGMTAANRIVIDERRDVLRVPSQALRYSPASAGGTATRRSGPSTRSRTVPEAAVWVLRDGKPVRVAVTAGLDDDTFTEIVQGDLKAGDRVIIAEQRATNNNRAATPRLQL